VEETVTGMVNARKKMALVGGSHLSAGERKKMGTGSGNEDMGRGLFSLLGRMVPRGPFLIFFSFLLFLFLFSYFFYIYCKTPSIQFKQNSKFF
jgi:hypothetical protein